MRVALCSVVVLASLAPRVFAQPHDIVVETPGERSTGNKLALGGMAAAGVLAGALGLYYHLDSRSLSDDVSADSATGRPWTSDLQSKVDRASDDRTKAAVFYSVGGVLIAGAIVALIVTEPKSETTVIRPHTAMPILAPAQGGGAVVGGAWSF